MPQSDSLQLNGLTHRLILGKRADFVGLPRHFVIAERTALAAALRPFAAPGSTDLARLRQLYRRIAFIGPASDGHDFAAQLAASLIARGYCAVRFRKDDGGSVLPVMPVQGIATVKAADFHAAKMEDKYAWVLELTLPHLPGEMRNAFAYLLSPAAIGTTVAILMLWAGSHAIGVGFAIDVLLLAIGFAVAGWAIFGAVGELLEFFEIMKTARSEADLESAARKLAAAIAVLGVGTFIAILTRGAGRIATAKNAGFPGRSSGSAAASDTQIAKYKPKTEETIRRRKKAVDERNDTNASISTSSVVGSKSAPATPKQLQKKYKHAADFGIEGSYNEENADRFNAAIQKHLNQSGVKEIQGSYRGDPVIFHTDPTTGLTVLQKPDGSFLSGWKLNPQQLHHVLTDAKL